MHGSSKSHRTVASLVAVLAVLLAAAPASALESSLLSGYGGPGQGNQAILGAALLNGPRSGGDGGGPGGAAGFATAGATSGRTATGPGSVAPTGSAARRPLPTVSRQGKHAASGVRQVLTTGASRPARADSATLGLSGQDFLYILLALAALACTGVFTRRLARMTPAGRRR